MQITISDELKDALADLQKAMPDTSLGTIVERAIYEFDLREKIKAGLEDEAAGRVKIFDPEIFKQQIVEKAANGNS